MAQNNQIVSVSKGMVDDLHSVLTPESNPTYVLNGNVSNFNGNEFFIQNEPSNILKTKMEEGFKVIGFIEIHEQKRVVYFLVNPLTNDSEIGEIRECLYNDITDKEYISGCEDCTDVYNYEATPLEEKEQVPFCSYRTIISEKCLNFNINNPIDIEYELKACTVNLYFTDNLSQRRHIRFTYENNIPSNDLELDIYYKNVIGFVDDACREPIYGDSLDCNKLNYHPDFKKPCIDLVGITTGGALKAGTYQFLISYCDEKGNELTQYFPASQNIPIKTKNVTVATNYVTDSSINILINNIENVVYEYFNMVVAETVDGITSFKLIGTYSTQLADTNNTITFTYNGINFIRDYSITDVIYKRPYYDTAASITKSNDYLFFSNLKEFPQPNLQRVANNIKLYWQTIAIPESVYNNPNNVYKYRTYQRDEVYGFGIVFETTHGEDTCAFHIPNREPVDSDLQYVTGDDVFKENGCETETIHGIPVNSKPRWEIYNTASVLGQPHNIFEDCKDNSCWEWGDFAYWHSSEKYPNEPEVWGDLCGKNIKLHKFPDSCVSHIHDGFNGTKDYSDGNIVYPIGVKVDHLSITNALDLAVQQTVITQSQRDSIKGYRIVRLNRYGQKSVIAKGLLYDMWKYDRSGSGYYYANYPFNDLRPDKFISTTDKTYGDSTTSDPRPISFVKSGRYTFHSPDTHFNSPSLGSYLKLETEEYGKSEGFFNYAEEQAKYKRPSTTAVTIALGIALASALSQEKHKECKTVVIKSETTVGLTAGTTAGTIVDPINPSLYEKNTGLPIRFQPLVGEVHKNTCTGTPYHMSSLASAIPGTPNFDPLMAAFKIVSGVFNQITYLLSIVLRELDRWMKFFESLIPYKNYAAQYQAVGKYNNYKCVSNNQGIKIRRLDRSAYLEPIIQNVDETIQSSGLFSTVNINNWNRESSVYLKTDSKKSLLPNTSVVDNSRILMSDVGIKETDSDKFTKKLYRDISSFYGSIKRNIPNQYGSVNGFEYLETDGCVTLLSSNPSECTTYFGGDTFINRFALKRKMPFFLETRFRFSNDADVIYSELGNVGYPNFYMNTEEPLFQRLEDLNGGLGSIYQKLIGVDRGRLDGRTSKLFYQNGFIHLYNYGIPYFLVESDYNVDYRHAENLKEKSYYPLSSDIKEWLQEKNVPISFDNTYIYNNTYSRQNKESFICTPSYNINSFKDCVAKLPNRLIYSEPNKFLVFKANSFKNFDLTNGTLISADGIESDKVLVRFENTSKIFNAYNTIQTSSETLQVGTGGMFQSRPQDFSTTDLGYAGTQHRDILKTEYGHIWVDAERGQVFNLQTGGEGLDELTKEGMRHWFKNNLPFEIKKHFPQIASEDLDNNFKGIGLHLGFDKRYARFFITKLDYKPIITGIVYDTQVKEFYYNKERIFVHDTKYFCNKSWTVSYSFFLKGWLSYYSFKPNFYVENIDNFETGIQQDTCSIWSHDLTNKSYQVFYGKLEPFTVEYVTKFNAANNFVNSIEYLVDVIRYHNDNDYFYNTNITFNKGIVYNENQSSGLLEFVKENPDDLSQFVEYPIAKKDSTEILTSNSENMWRFNDFYNICKSEINNVPLFLNTCANDNKFINEKSVNYYTSDFNKSRIRSRQTRVRLTNDKHSNYKFIFLLSLLNQNISFR